MKRYSVAFSFIGVCLCGGFGVVSAAPLARALERSAFSAEEQAALIALVTAAHREGLPEELIERKVFEGMAKRVPYEKIHAVALQKKFDLAAIRKFCLKTAASKTVLAFSPETARAIDAALTTALTIEELTDLHGLFALVKNSERDFLELVRVCAHAKRQGISFELQRSLLAPNRAREHRAIVYAKLLNSIPTSDPAEFRDSVRVITQSIAAGRNTQEIIAEMQDRWVIAPQAGARANQHEPEQRERSSGRTGAPEPGGHQPKGHGR